MKTYGIGAPKDDRTTNADAKSLRLMAGICREIDDERFKIQNRNSMEVNMGPVKQTYSEKFDTV